MPKAKLFPHWVDRRHWWEPVKKYKTFKWAGWFRVSTKASRSGIGNWDQLEKHYDALKKSMPTKTKAPINFRIKRSPRTKQFRCVIVGGNGEPTFVGEPCKNRKDVHDTIASHIRAILTGNYVMPDTFDGSLELAKKLTKKCCGKGCKKTKPVKWGKLNRNWP